ncbi:MAG: serine hydrolase domain-containing protein [Acidimicrobiales bacterium]
MPLLSPIHDWPVDTVAAAALLPDGSIEADGPVDQVLALASLTKLLTACAALVAVEDGSTALDEPVGPRGSTLRHLLAHASGLGPDGDVLAPPAQRRIYSNAGYEIVADHVAAVTGLPFATWTTEAVLAPLGMTATRLDGSPASGAVGTVSDLVRFVQALVADEPLVLARQTVDDARSVAWPGLAGVLPGFGSHDDNTWGLGFEIRGSKDPHWTPDAADPATFGHFGRSGSLLWVDPVAGASLVVLGDRDFGEWAPPLWRDLGDRVLRSAAERSGIPR